MNIYENLSVTDTAFVNIGDTSAEKALFRHDLSSCKQLDKPKRKARVIEAALIHPRKATADRWFSSSFAREFW
jgi:hypothetical protein